MRKVADYTLSSPDKDLTVQTYVEAVLLGFTVGFTSPLTIVIVL